MRRRTILSLLVAVIVAPFALGQENLPPGAKVKRLEARPTTIELANPFDYAQLLVTGTLDNGDRVDVTRLCQLDKPAAVRVSPTGLVRPVADGKGELKLRLGDQSLAVPVTVSGQKTAHKIGFIRDVMPVLSKVGCNAGTCHGAADGKNGFKLSLRGYDPVFDHRSLTDDLQGRRFNRAAPDASLMLLKLSGAVPHVGGVLTKQGETYYELLRTWIAAGAPFDKESPRVTGLDVFPKNPTVPLPGMKQQMVVVATYSDGATRDVTAEAFIESSNSEVATADKQGLITGVRRGESAMMARYEGSYAATTLVVMGDRSGFTWKAAPENNWIDTLVYEKLKAMKIQPSELCSDADFLRRLYIDLTGLPPEPEQVRAFLADSRPTRVKRDELIDKLVGSPDFIEHWTNKWADLLQVNRKFLGDKGATAFREYIRKALVENKPYDRFVRDILTATGSTADNPAAAYYKILRDPAGAMENTTQLFLAVRFNCNKCHDHPFERWTQDQYYQLASYFAQVERKEDTRYAGQKIGGTMVDQPLPLVETIADKNQGDVKHERTGAITAPALPYNHVDVAGMGTRRQQLAHWLTSKENQYFAKSYVNRLWSYLLGVGLIEPIDDIRAGNPPTNPKLLDRLTKEFIDSEFDAQQLLRTICKSRTYQHALATNAWNADDEINYSHALARRLSAEVLYDSIHRALGSVSKIEGLPAGTRAAQLVDAAPGTSGTFLDLFGKPPRESACECERSSGVLLGPVLNLINGPTIANAIKDPENRLEKILLKNKDDRKAVEELFLAVLNRLPTEKEIDYAVKELRGHRDEFDLLVAEAKRRQTAFADYDKASTARYLQQEQKLKSSMFWTVLDPQKAEAGTGTMLTKQPDQSLLASGANEPGVYRVTLTPKQNGITALRLDALADPSLPGRGPGRAADGNFVLSELRLFVVLPKSNLVGPPAPLPLARATADFSQGQFEIAKLIDGDTKTSWAIAPQFGRNHTAVIEFKQPLALPEGATLVLELEHRYQKIYQLGRFRLAATTGKPSLQGEVFTDAFATALATDPAKRTKEQQQTMFNYFRALDTELVRLQNAARELGNPTDPRLIGAQDVAWALLNSPAFLFNH